MRPTVMRFFYLRAMNTASELCCSLFLLVLLIALTLKKEHTRSYQCIALLYLGELVSMLTSIFQWYVEWKNGPEWIVYPNYTLAFAASVLTVCAMYWYFLAFFEERGTSPTKKSVKRGIVPFGVLIVLIFAALLTVNRREYAYAPSLERRAFYYFAITMATTPIALVTLIQVIRCRKSLRWYETTVFASYCVVPRIAAVVDLLGYTTTMHIAMTLVSCLLFVGVSAEQERELITKDKALTESRLYSAIQRINPHFIYNTLASIDSLTRTDPEGAQKLISMFSEYLGDNYADITEKPLIPFSKELEHLEHYLTIERVRFPNITVRYDIRATDFMLPSLTVQPLAENAIKHGICRRRKSIGTLSISSYEEEENVIITVTDDGIGFTPEALTDGEEHIGIENVRMRLEMLCGGKLEIISEPEKGTDCKIILPKGVNGYDRALRR